MFLMFYNLILFLWFVFIVLYTINRFVVSNNVFSNKCLDSTYNVQPRPIFNRYASVYTLDVQKKNIINQTKHYKCLNTSQEFKLTEYFEIYIA
jgi:hypothetical protein